MDARFGEMAELFEIITPGSVKMLDPRGINEALGFDMVDWMQKTSTHHQVISLCIFRRKCC